MCPITKRPLHLVGTLFVDDTDLVHLDTNKVETIAEAHAAMQDSIHSWGRILIATGGALKPVKMFLPPDIIQLEARWDVAILP